MADRSEDAGNLDVQKGINEAIAARTALLSKQTDIIKGQVQLAVELCKALKCEDLDSITSRTQEISNALSASQKEAKGLEGSLTSTSGAAQKAAKSTQKVEKQVNRLEEAAKSFGDIAGEAFSRTMSQLDSLTSLTGAVGRGVFGIAQSIIAIPLGIFSKLLGMASDLASQTDPLREAMEDVRKTFGDLNRAEARQTLDAFDNIRESAGSLAGSGLALSKVYGYGREGLATALRDVLQTAEAMGPVFGALGDQFTDNAASLLVMQKGLGMTGDDMKAFGSFALMSGQNVNDVLLETANMSLQMGEKFGISSKLIGKDMAYMTQNIGKFGSMTKTQMATATVYVRKLGLEIKDVEGLIGVFDDFEGAATAASKLAQAFGMNVDAMQMMQEQDPAKRLDSLRQAFAATGKSIESMSRQEKALLAQTAGLDENTVSLALSTENMGMSYDEIQKAAEESGDKQLSQAEIMQKTSENIERLIQNLNQTTGSFLDTFLNGFMKGISQTKEFKAMMQSLSKALVEVFKFGMDVGKIFVDMFPGIKDMMGGVTGFFNPKKIRELLNGFIEPIKQFFSDLSKDPVKATEKFMKTIKEKLLNFFDSKSADGSKFLDGMKSFGKAMAGILGAMGKYLITAAADAIKGLAEYLRNPKGLSDSAKDGIGSIIGPMVGAIMDALPALGSALLDLVGAILTEYGPQIAILVSGLMAANLASGMMGAVVEVGKSAVVEVAKQKLMKMMGAFAAPDGTEPQGDGGAGAVKILGGVVDAFNNINVGQVMKAVGVAAVLVVFAMVSIVGFAIAVRVAAEILKKVEMADVIKVFAATAVGVMAMLPLIAIAAIPAVAAGAVSAIPGMLALAGFALIGIVAFAGAVKIASMVLDGVEMNEIVKVFAATGMGIIASVALAAVAALAVAAAPAFLIGVGGLIAAAAFMTLGVSVFGLALQALVATYPKFDVKKVVMIMGLTLIALLAAVALGVAGALAVTPMALAAMVLAGVGISEIGEFLVETVGDLGKALAIITNIPMKDPEEMKARMDVVAGLVNSLSSFAGLAVSAAEIGKVSSVLGGGGIAEAIGAMNSFMQTAVNSIIGLVTEVSKIAAGYDEAQLAKMGAVANVIGAIAQLASALTGPMDSLSKVEDSLFGDSASVKINNIVGGLEKIISAISKELPGIIDKVIKIPTEGLTPEKADSLSKLMTGIASITKAMNENAQMMQEEGFDATKVLANFEDALKNVDLGLGHLKQYMPLISESVKTLEGYKNVQLGGTVKAIVDDIMAVNNAMAEIGAVDINATIAKVGGALGLKDEILKVESKPIQMNVNINLTMKADDIAKEIMDVTAKIAKDKDKASGGMKDLFPGYAQ